MLARFICVQVTHTHSPTPIQILSFFSMTHLSLWCMKIRWACWCVYYHVMVFRVSSFVSGNRSNMELLQTRWINC